MKDKKWYVYIYYRLDTNEPFYVGKGCKNRWKLLYDRSSHFINIANKYNIVAEIVKDNLTEGEAFGIECWLINELVFEYGYSIDIKGNRSIDEKYNHLVNQTWGGEGTSGNDWTEGKTEEEMLEWKRKNSKLKMGELNPMYGGNFSEEHRRRMSESHKGEKAYWYGKTFSEDHKRKISENHADVSGENHPMYGKHHTEETKNKLSEINTGKNSPKAKSVICLTTKRIFYTITEGGRYYNVNPTSITACCKGKYKSAGKLENKKLVWRYLVWKHNKKYRIRKRWYRNE